MTIAEMDRNIRLIFEWMPYTEVPRDREGRVKLVVVNVFGDDRVAPDYHPRKSQ